MPFFRRIPKRGFSNSRFRIAYDVVNVGDLEDVFGDGAEVTPQALVTAGLIRNVHVPIKVLGDGDLTKKLTVLAEKFSRSAREKITAAGGAVRERVAKG